MKARELLIATVLVTVLAIVLFSVFRSQQETAREVEAMRNLQLWGIALNLFLIDNDNTLPSVGKTPVTAEQKNAWFNSLPPYVSHQPLTNLPPAQRPRPGVPSLWISPATNPARIWDDTQFYFNYAMNSALQPNQELRSFRIGELGLPGKVIFLGEVQGFLPALTPENLVTEWGTRRTTSPAARAHILFCDGHVELLSREVLVDDPNTRSVDNLQNGGISWFME